MSPIPERMDISPEMFAGLEGETFTQVHKAIDILSNNTQSVILEPPGREVVISNHEFPDALKQSTKIGVSKAILFRDNELSRCLDLFLDTRFIPRSWRALENNNQLEQLFDINISFEKESQIISVKRVGLPDIKFQHDGLERPINEATRHAILALAIIPDELWGEIPSKGLLVGELYGNDYDLPWKVVGLSNNLPDPKGMIKYHADIGREEEIEKLSNFSVGSLREAKKLDSLSEVYKSLDPIGVFIDKRDRKKTYR